MRVVVEMWVGDFFIFHPLTRTCLLYNAGTFYLVQPIPQILSAQSLPPHAGDGYIHPTWIILASIHNKRLAQSPPDVASFIGLLDIFPPVPGQIQLACGLCHLAHQTSRQRCQ